MFCFLGSVVDSSEFVVVILLFIFFTIFSYKLVLYFPANEASLLQPEANAYRGVNSGYHKASWECVVGNYSEPAVAMNIPFPLDVPVAA